jgi:hypothetical protein
MLSMYCFVMKIVVSTQLLIKKQKAPIKKIAEFLPSSLVSISDAHDETNDKKIMCIIPPSLYFLVTIIQQIKYLVLKIVLSKYDLSLPMQDFVENILLMKVMKCQY